MRYCVHCADDRCRYTCGVHCAAARGSFTVFVLTDEAESEGQDCEHAHPTGNRDDDACCVRGVVAMLHACCGCYAACVL
jgi:hypothetical protein